MDLILSVIATTLIIIPISVLDNFLLYRRDIIHENHRWCFIHSVVNLVVVLLTVRGTWTLLSSDSYQAALSVLDAGFNISSSIVVMAAHLYHLLNFKITDPSLLAHHYLMMAVLTIPYLTVGNQRFMFFTDYSLFFLCGLPGMIDYYCMHLCYSGRMERIREKRINNFLNTYIRAPGIMYGAFFTYRMWINGEITALYSVPVILTFYWNAQFFSNAVAVSYGYALADQE